MDADKLSPHSPKRKHKGNNRSTMSNTVLDGSFYLAVRPHFNTKYFNEQKELIYLNIAAYLSFAVDKATNLARCNLEVLVSVIFSISSTSSLN